ncbi:MAG: DsbC family protein [Gammaproteobacteria bacterium]|nr:DsbC family protein [Gammaproteobacteria bacterium]
MKIRSKLLSLLAFSFIATAVAADEAQIKQLRDQLNEKIPGLKIDSIVETPVPGVLELMADGDIYYMTPDGAYMFQGSLIDLDKKINLTDKRKGSVHIGLINAIPEEKMLVFSPKEPAKREMTVFTDTSCPYCSKLHSEIDQLTDAGIKVRYLLYPRAGLGSPAHKQLESVWCAENRQEAMTLAKEGQAIEEKTCDNPIEEHIALAHKVGLRGTPLIYLDSGEIVNGYRPAGQLVEMFENSEPMDKPQ